jgi:transglutaminase-like putative cysteine protease
MDNSTEGSADLPSADLSQCTRATPCVDFDSLAVQAFIKANRNPNESLQEQAVSLYFAVRDGFRYDPYRIDFSPLGMSASRVIENGYGHCISKAALLAACTRSIGIPTRLGFADVKNHLTSKRLLDVMGSDVFAWHGYAELLLDGKWVKATPAFDIALCERAGVIPLDFDGSEDSIYHAFDASGRKHMEYLRPRGTFVEIPLSDIITTYLAMYPGAAKHYVTSATLTLGTHDFASEVGQPSGAKSAKS